MFEKRISKWLALAGTALLALGVGLALGFYWDYITETISTASGGSVVRLGEQGFTNPLLDCDVGAETIGSSKQDFSAQLSSFVTVLKQKPDVSEVAIYFRDLNNGPVFGVNQDEGFLPASLLKVPIMMAYFNRSEDDPKLLQEKVTFEKDSPLLPDTQMIVPEQQIQIGKTYTIEQLIEYMIKYSDNQAMALLYNRLPVADQIDLYNQIGVDPSVVSDSTAELTVKQYSVFFRILFNASYLSRADSEKALTLLSESTFNDGLRAGVPAAIPIAHKFGERHFDNQLQQVHDCGIVYYPKHPYLLCIMTRGDDVPALTQAIADTSRFVYEKIDAQYGSN